MHSNSPAFAGASSIARGRFGRVGRVGLIAAVVALMSLACGWPLAARADALQDVSKLVAAGNLDAAEKQADAYLKTAPKDAQMRFLKGVVVAQRGRRDEAVTLFTGITQDYPELPEPYNNLAVIYAAQGDYDKARAALESAIRVAPNYATAYENLGDVYAALAARAYQDSRRHDAGNAAALRKLNATRALLTATGPAPTVSQTSTAAPTAAAPTATSQRNVGLPSPAGPRVTVGGFGSTGPEIVVPADAPSVPLGSNVVAIETPRADDERESTSTLNGAKTIIPASGADVPPDPAEAIAAVTATVRRWAEARSVATDRLQVRIDGDAATARFRETPLRDAKSRATAAANGGYVAPIDRILTLRRGGGAADTPQAATWTVVDASSGR